MSESICINVQVDTHLHPPAVKEINTSLYGEHPLESEAEPSLKTLEQTTTWTLP